MDESIEELYLNWLGVKVVDASPRVYAHWRLIGQLHRTEFVWLLTGDDNRAVDGKELRDEFILESRTHPDEEWHSLGCSCLEMFIAFSRRAEFNTEIPAKAWFWEFVQNLGLKDLAPEDVTDALYRFMWRLYRPDGSDGGLFPLNSPSQDQRKVEIWYQFNEYLVDQNRI